MFKKTLFLIISVLTIFSVSACDDPNDTGPITNTGNNGGTDGTIEINYSKTISMKEGKELKLSVSYEFNDDNEAEPEVSVSNPSVINAQLSNFATSGVCDLNIRALRDGESELKVFKKGSESSVFAKVTIMVTKEYEEGEFGGEMSPVESTHYLTFLADGIVVGKMVVLPSDTYEALSKFFPTIPEKPNYGSYWEELDEVYDVKYLNIEIWAYYYLLG